MILTKEHDPDAKCTIFHNDVRAYGKDFERYYQRTENLPGVRFIRSYVSIGKEISDSKNVTIRYSTTDDGVKEEEFDMVVLSIGLNPPSEVKSIADKFGIELESHGFCKTNPTNPMETTRPGVFISGAFQGPIDIPESVFTASGASSQVGELLNYRRGKLKKERIYPKEQDVASEKPRIGVFVCHCGANISRIVSVPSVVDYALTLPNVVFAKNQLFSCATNSAKEITDTIKEQKLNRVIVAACSPRTLEALFRDTLREAGINQYYYEMANIREHCSWVHQKEKEEATRKAKEILRMSVARANLLAPLQEIDLNVNPAAVVVGGGVAGMTTALSVANQGHEVYLIEKENKLGGIARRLHTTLEGLDVQKYLQDLIKKVQQHPLIHLYLSASVADATGYIGNFVTKIKTDQGVVDIKHGATVIATGAEEYKPTEYLYGKNSNVMTLMDLEEKVASEDPELMNARSLVMIQCVGSRDPETRNYCSRVCCQHSIKDAIKLKEKRPDMDIYILFRDIRTYGLKEDYYRLAAEKEIRFIRYTPEDKPTVEEIEKEGKKILRIMVTDPILGGKVSIEADKLALAAAVIPPEGNKETSNQFKLTFSPDGFFKEAHVKLRPVDFSTDGVYLCGTAHYPKTLNETISHAYGAAGRVLTLLSRKTVVASGSICDVVDKKCMACGACIDACKYGAIEFKDTPSGKKATVNPVICKGDGLCNAKCPTGAIRLKHFTDEEIESEIDVAFPETVEAKR